MKTKFLFLMILLSSTFCFAADKGSILLTGASFAVPENGWFETGCEVLGFKPINKAVSGSAIKQTAQAMSKGTLYTKVQLDDIDAFVIMHVHNQNVANEQWLKEDYNDYVLGDATPYNVAYDYVIRKYKDDCRNLKDEPTSKYYGTPDGKPATIVLCTHWHDARTTYNSAIRKLVEKWNLPLIEWDTQIGFTKDILDSDGKQPSLSFAQDTEKIPKPNGIAYGWHPKRGQGEYIQRKMAEIYINKMADVFHIVLPLKASLKPKEIAIFDGEKAHIRVDLTGLSPWDFSYSLNGMEITKSNIGINEAPLMLEIPYSSKKPLQISPISVSNPQVAEGEIEGSEKIYFADDSIVAFYDAYVHEYYKDKSYTEDTIIQLKTGDGWTRQAYFSFNLSKVSPTDEKIVFRSYFSESNVAANLVLQLEGNTKTYTNKLNWNTKDKETFSVIGTNEMYFSEVGSYICWDVTDYVKQQKEAGNNIVTLRMSVCEGIGALCSFPSIESDNLAYYPSLLIVREDPVGTDAKVFDKMNVFPTVFDNFLTIVSEEGSGINISSVTGHCFLNEENTILSNYNIDTTSYPKGVYIIQCKSPSGRSISNKVIKL